MINIKQTIFSINGGCDNTSIDDIVYFSRKWMSNARLGQFGSWLKKQAWFIEMVDRRNVRGFREMNSHNAGQLAFIILEQEWNFPNRSSWSDGKEKPAPEWMSLLPKDVRRQLKRDYAIQGGVEPLGIVPAFPYMGFGYIVRDFEDDGYTMASEAAQVFKLHRLHEVKQLSYLKDPVGFQDDRATFTLPFPHTRYLHSLDVLAVSTLIANNCSLTPQEKTILQLAGEVHDALTPAGGDATKLIDRELFDEDLHFPKLLQGPEWEEFQVKWKVDGELLTRTVRGEGVLGSLLNIADKTSYISRDASAFLGMSGRLLGAEKYAGAGYYTIADITEKNPHVTALWEVTKVINGKVVITDPDRLGTLLILRSFLFKELYYNPYSRFFEYLLGKGATKILYESGKITYEELMTHGDQWLENKVDEFFNVQHVLTRFHNLENARIEEVHDIRSACRRAAEFDNDLSVTVIIDDFEHVSNSASRGWLVKDKGEVKLFSKARPNLAERIDRIMKFPPIKRLYFYNLNDLAIPNDSRKRIKSAFINLRQKMEKKLG